MGGQGRESRTSGPSVLMQLSCFKVIVNESKGQGKLLGGVGPVRVI